MFKTLKSKLLGLGLVSAFSANSAFAAITLSSDGAVSGSVDMSTFYGVAGVVMTTLGVVYAVKTGLRLLRG